jgi:hypothetical protein
MSRPALGKFIFPAFIWTKPLELTADQVQIEQKGFRPAWLPVNLANSLFHALRYKDYKYLLVDSGYAADFRENYSINLKKP